jgi:hypothetical protein
MIVVVILISIVAVFASGCISDITDVINPPKVKTFADLMHKTVEDTASWKQTQIDKDTVRVRFYRPTNDSKYLNYYDLTIKQFKTTDDAAKFVNSINQGYIPGYLKAWNIDVINIYSKTTGHKPTIKDSYVSVVSVIPGSGKVIFHTDELVLYGTFTSSISQVIISK